MLKLLTKAVSSILVFTIPILLPGKGFTEELTLDNEKSRLSYISDIYAQHLRNIDRIYQDNEVSEYLQNILAKLYPEYMNHLQVRIYNSCEINAEATINGKIYIMLGMLAKAGSEAQIASVLAHEGAHIINEHQLKNLQNQKYILTGGDFYGVERTLEYLSNYSIELEQAADDVGFERLTSAGYAAKEAIKIFQSMADEAKIRYQTASSLYSSHPKLTDRIAHYKKLSIGRNGFAGETEYLNKLSAIKLECLKRNVSIYRYRSILLDLENNQKLTQHLPQTWFYLGEAYRQRARKGDLQNSELAYMAAIKSVPDFAPAYRAMGILNIKKQKYDAARHYFDKYKLLAPKAIDNPYIGQYYKIIDSNGKKQ